MASKPIVLLLEDDERFLSQMKERIHKHFQNRIRILAADSLAAAEKYLSDHGPSIAVLVTDVMMPDGEPGGIELAARYAARLPVIVVSAFGRDSFKRKTETLGSVVFIEKSGSAGFSKELVSAIEAALEPLDDRNLCLTRQTGTIMTVRFRLADISPVHVPNLNLRDLDFAAIAFGCREWESSVKAAGGGISSIHNQTLQSAFLDQAQNQDSFRRAVDAFVNTCNRMENEFKAGSDKCPFGAAVLTGMVTSGLFGQRTPGHPAIVGRLGDIACHLAFSAQSRELAVVQSWITSANQRYLKTALGPPARQELMRPADLSSPVEVTFHKWQA